MSSDMTRTLHTIVFMDGDMFIASGVELDVVAQGATAEEAMNRLEVVLNAEVQEARHTGRDVFDLGPAPSSVQAMFREDDVLAKDERLVA
jgi:predicted RNase H-like HicB family nuclease